MRKGEFVSIENTSTLQEVTLDGKQGVGGGFEWKESRYDMRYHTRVLFVFHDVGEVIKLVDISLNGKKRLRNISLHFEELRLKKMKKSIGPLSNLEKGEDGCITTSKSTNSS